MFTKKPFSKKMKVSVISMNQDFTALNDKLYVLAYCNSQSDIVEPTKFHPKFGIALVRREFPDQAKPYCYSIIDTDFNAIPILPLYGKHPSYDLCFDGRDGVMAFGIEYYDEGEEVVSYDYDYGHLALAMWDQSGGSPVRIDFMGSDPEAACFFFIHIDPATSKRIIYFASFAQILNAGLNFATGKAYEAAFVK
jgi:hypothetical protein